MFPCWIGDTISDDNDDNDNDDDDDDELFLKITVEKYRFSFIFSWDHCQRFSSSQISDTFEARFEPPQNLSSDFIDWDCSVVITVTLRRHKSSETLKSHTQTRWYFSRLAVSSCRVRACFFYIFLFYVSFTVKLSCKQQHLLI